MSTRDVVTLCSDFFYSVFCKSNILSAAICSLLTRLELPCRSKIRKQNIAGPFRFFMERLAYAPVTSADHRKNARNGRNAPGAPWCPASSLQVRSPIAMQPKRISPDLTGLQNDSFRKEKRSELGTSGNYRCRLVPLMSQCSEPEWKSHRIHVWHIC